jgi:hypothetical protein
VLLLNWTLSHRFDAAALPMADRHYNRRKPGSPQFVPPGRCCVLLADGALWVTSWPFAEYVKHQWPGAWVNSLFRRESGPEASALILEAVAATRWFFGDPPALGLVTFVDPKKVKPTYRRGLAIYGYCYLKAGFERDDDTVGGLWAWRLSPERMPQPCAPRGVTLRLLA